MPLAEHYSSVKITYRSVYMPHYDWFVVLFEFSFGSLGLANKHLCNSNKNARPPDWITLYFAFITFHDVHNIITDISLGHRVVSQHYHIIILGTSCCQSTLSQQYPWDIVLSVNIITEISLGHRVVSQHYHRNIPGTSCCQSTLSQKYPWDIVLSVNILMNSTA